MIRASHANLPNAVGTITGAVGCTPHCSENPVTSMIFCDNKGIVQVSYQLYGDQDVFQANITPPFVCSSDPCCASVISSNQVVYFRVDDGQIKYVAQAADNDVGDTFIFGVICVVGSVLLLLCVIGTVIMFCRRESAYTQV